MKTLLLKEIRENAKLAVPGLLLLTLILFQQYSEFSNAMKQLVLGNLDVPIDSWQPLTSRKLLFELAWFFGVFGLVLGFFQSWNEANRDLWAFLVHRPMTRDAVFLGKVAAGLILYSAASLVPLAIFIGWALLPGHVPAPSELAVFYPIIAMFLLGIVGYFAGMVVGLRQARWYAGRVVPAAAVFLLGMTAMMCQNFWQALLFLLGSAAVGALAAWGCFQTHGSYEGQPPIAKAALAVSVASGALVVLFLAVLLASPMLRNWAKPEIWVSYNMGKDGTLYKSTMGDQGPGQILDLNGNPLKNPKTGELVPPSDFNSLASRNQSLAVKWPAPRRYFETRQLFSFWQVTPGSVWYYWARYGRLVGYETRTARFIGSIGPNGFAPGLSGSGDHFDYDPGTVPSMYTRTLKTTTGVFRIDPAERKVQPILTTTPEDPILAAADIQERRSDWEYTMVTTKRFVFLVHSSGELAWKIPFDPSFPDYNRIMVSTLEPPGHWAVWICPSFQALGASPKRLPLRITWLSGDKVEKTVDVPDLARDTSKRSRVEQLAALVVPPALLVSMPFFASDFHPEHTPAHILFGTLLLAALICVPLVLWLSSRYQLSIPARVAWAVFNLAAGLPGLLAFLAVNEWPAREKCPGCGKLRVVTGERCQSCGASFAPPAMTGTEIFETVAAPVPQ